MKILAVLLTMFSFIYGAQIDEFASEVNYLRDYKTAVKAAQEQNKMVMMVVVGDYCPWCKKFERKTLKSSVVMEKVNKDFVALVIDKFKDKGTYPEGFYPPLIPTVFFIDPQSEKPILDTVAYMKKGEFMENINEAETLFSKGGK